MSTEQVAPEISWSSRASAEAVRQHPLSPLTAAEIKASAEVIKSLYIPGTGLLFKQITLLEPKKAQLAPYLDAQNQGKSVSQLDRKAFISYYIKNTVSLLLQTSLREILYSTT